MTLPCCLATGAHCLRQLFLRAWLGTARKGRVHHPRQKKTKISGIRFELFDISTFRHFDFDIVTVDIFIVDILTVRHGNTVFAVHVYIK